MIIRRTTLAAAALAVLTLTACHPSTTASGGAPASAGSAVLAADDPNAPMPAAGTCKEGSRDGQPLPDPACTPGAVNPAVTQANIGDTVCKSGWTKTVRPPTSKTNRMKAASARSYGLPDGAQGEYDHLVSLELGGGPDDPRNLWVEPGTIPNPKDAVENKLHDAVCSGLIPLATAQKAIAGDWVTAYDDAGLRVVNGKVCLRDNPSRCATRGGDGTGE
ncbi:hypothetical protein ORV05_19670 [Amycolatopsis cynarae]|uniref:HNH endonuclease n=1 Tax=Amycolatopsis cynarae TaxID=2995223 RepID=A0ABY7ATL0_9PSEU|nr:hypothetical protein [Amycolatopsis sp. HUAS 11-8]WAL63246.1 hypothetical protein ORV05_19670 [Amycolatopsis sp. HUAS 11-8]